MKCFLRLVVFSLVFSVVMLAPTNESVTNITNHDADKHIEHSKTKIKTVNLKVLKCDELPSLKINLLPKYKNLKDFDTDKNKIELDLKDIDETHKGHHKDNKEREPIKILQRKHKRQMLNPMFKPNYLYPYYNFQSNKPDLPLLPLPSKFASYYQPYYYQPVQSIIPHKEEESRKAESKQEDCIKDGRDGLNNNLNATISNTTNVPLHGKSHLTITVTVNLINATKTKKISENLVDGNIDDDCEYDDEDNKTGDEQSHESCEEIHEAEENGSKEGDLIDIPEDDCEENDVSDRNDIEEDNKEYLENNVDDSNCDDNRSANSTDMCTGGCKEVMKINQPICFVIFIQNGPCLCNYFWKLCLE